MTDDLLSMRLVIDPKQQRQTTEANNNEGLIILRSLMNGFSVLRDVERFYFVSVEMLK